MNPNSILRKVMIKHKKGLHARVAAMIVQKAVELQKEHEVIFKVQKGTFKEVPLTSILLLISMRIKAGEEIEILTIGNDVIETKEASEKMGIYLESDFDYDQTSMNSIDNLLQDNILTAENIFNNIGNGLLVIDENNIVTLFNTEAERLFGITSDQIIGKNIKEVMPESELPEVARTKKPKIGYTQNRGKYTIVTNTTPLIVENETRGAVSILEDISKLVKISWQLKEIKELKEKYQLILESVQDGICVFDHKGKITYVNVAYCQIVGKNLKELMGKNIHDLSPEGDRVKVLKTGQPILGGISEKENGVTIVANINPLIVDGQIRGGISTIKDITQLQDLMEKLNQISAKADYLQEELIRTKRLGPAFDRIIGVSGKIYDSMAIAAKASLSNYTVLIRGESGTGKELIAEAIHYSSARDKEPFIRVNCGAIPPTLLESELFGHEKGAFTSAVKTKLGRFELAHKGTIFLDEIGELDKSMQVKLLRVVQNKEFQRVGGEKTIKVDVRIVAATNQNLEELLKTGDFREDLYYRLNVIPIWLPPLRERKEDIPVLVEYFAEKICKDLERDSIILEKEAMHALIQYDWPGNVRELENIMERTIILLDGDVIRLGHIPSYVVGNHQENMNKSVESLITEMDHELTYEEYEKIIIKKALKKHGSYNKAGKALGLTHNTVAAKARKFNIRFEDLID
ncbi:Fis family transcriptional regulator [Petrocella atlantisensis]|uniref:HTH-type transcriptional regulatory protein TyrR n=1 Tax=Petrocella atlantisensis TaxID=2173034 RepID=A0A3P7NUG3_9FIRM|nr:sigma 54-interacting transcriptional regulator [Petrocella atlantisensis]VDN46784.1 Fis family transcriptional regulator [Petrocella atlantisensis]